MELEPKLREECGVFGAIAPEKQQIADDIFCGLFALQHRGQESCGIALLKDSKEISFHKGVGLVSDVFNPTELAAAPKSSLGIGHVRYSTAGTGSFSNAQPIVSWGRYGQTAIAYNGNIINADELKASLVSSGITFQSASDCEVIAALINLHSKNSVEEGIVKTCRLLKGVFSIVMIIGGKLYVIRDKNGLRPLSIGKKPDGSICAASETCALDAVDAVFLRDVTPGEILCIDEKLNQTSVNYAPEQKRTCIFEFVYLARNDSFIDGFSVNETRYNAGRELAKLYKIKADIVAGVPESAVIAAKGYSDASGMPYVEVLFKNRYMGRTFIKPLQTQRENAVKMKFNILKTNVVGKKIILIDDSIVRGTTSKKIIANLRAAGAKEIHMLIASPMVLNACHFGVDIKDKNQLIGNELNCSEICKAIGADSLNYLPLPNLIKACSGKASNKNFCTGCFNGVYCIKMENKN